MSPITPLSCKDGTKAAAVPNRSSGKSTCQALLARTRLLVALSRPGERAWGKARRFKAVEPPPETMRHPDEGQKKPPPTARPIAQWITFKEEQRLEWQKDSLTRLCGAEPQIRKAAEVIQEFTALLRERQGARLDEWLAHVEKQGVDERHSCAQGRRKADAAVKAGLTLLWSQGPVEGPVHRLKLIKRQASGRASFQTLRKRILRCG